MMSQVQIPGKRQETQGDFFSSIQVLVDKFTDTCAGERQQVPHGISAQV